MYREDIEKKLEATFNEFAAFYIQKKFQEQFKQDAYITGSCIHALANDVAPINYLFAIAEPNLATDLMYEFRNMPEICVVTNTAVNFNDGKYKVSTIYIGDPYEVVAKLGFKQNMFFYYRGRITGLVVDSYLKTNRIIFNIEHAKDIAGVLLSVPYLLSRGMTITDSELAAMISKLCYNFNDNEKRILNERTGHRTDLRSMPAPQMPILQQSGFTLPF